MQKNTCELKNTVHQAVQNPVAAFAMGALCGLAIGLLCLPLSKGVVIGSYNGSHNKESFEEETLPVAED